MCDSWSGLAPSAMAAPVLPIRSALEAKGPAGGAIRERNLASALVRVRPT